MLQEDPLEAFMAEINQTAESEAVAKPLMKNTNIELDEDADNVVPLSELCVRAAAFLTASARLLRHELQQA